MIRFDEMPKDRHRELSARGGVKSGEVRRAKRERRERLLSLMEAHAVKEGFVDDIEAFHRWREARQKQR